MRCEVREFAKHDVIPRYNRCVRGDLHVIGKTFPAGIIREGENADTHLGLWSPSRDMD